MLEEKGVRQTWLAEKPGKNHDILNSYAPNRQRPRLKVLFEIAEIPDVDPKGLIQSEHE